VLKRNLAFRASQGRTETKVCGISKRQMAIVAARNVEAIRIRESFWITIRGGHDGNHCLTLLNLLTAQFAV
jgi:hypothetical protein